jgi:site-specific DNA-methyltransferase (adenine-specific)
MSIEIYCMDAIEFLKTLQDKSVDAIITDLPYGTTACSWDVIIPFEPMWEQVKRICKGVFVTTASQPFTSKLVMSNIENFKYTWVWDKGLSGNIFLAETQPMKIHEDIVIFSHGNHKYLPIMTTQKSRIMRNNGMKNSAFGSYEKYAGEIKTTLNPKSIIYIPNTDRKAIDHPTQKPVALYEYLIRTYTNEGDTVLDFTCGSGTTGVACVNTNRKCILNDNDSGYIEIARKRIHDAQQQMRLNI